IGKRYRRQDEIGTPYCIVIDFDSLGENLELLDTVTIRDRDTGTQQRITISELETFLQSKLDA
ncbi:glycine--tRNA ligase, partial [Patescibacteria group bacterium]|nr:glycine--tRNA ligase [Patescibacteria group bacterium]